VFLWTRGSGGYHPKKNAVNWNQSRQKKKGGKGARGQGGLRICSKTREIKVSSKSRVPNCAAPQRKDQGSVYDLGIMARKLPAK